MARIYSQEELQEFTAAEQELASVGLLVGDRFNTEVIIGYFDQHPELPATKLNVIAFVNHPKVKDKLRWKSEAQQKYDKATVGYQQSHQDILDAFLERMHLVHDPADDRTFENCAAIFGAMRGREWTTDNLRWVVDYLQGKGQKLHWLERPPQGRENRGHAHIPGERWAPKEDTNRGPLSRHSHSSDPRFNGENDRKKMERPGTAEQDLMKSHNAVWLMQAQTLQGQTHAETKRIQKVVSETPGGGYKAYQAGLKEQRLIENERAKAR